MEKPKFCPLVKFTPFKFHRSNFVHVTTSGTCNRAKFYCSSFTGACPQICEILRFCDFFVVLSCHVMSWLYFFLAIAPSSHPWTDFNCLWLKWRVLTQGCAFSEFWWRPTILRASNLPKTKMGAWLDISQRTLRSQPMHSWAAGQSGHWPSSRQGPIRVGVDDKKLIRD